jgi:hypothetical protein
MTSIVERIERELAMPGLAARLAKLGPSDLTSLLLAVDRARTAAKEPSRILAEYRNNRFVRPAATDPRRMIAWEQVAFGCLPSSFVPITLSPLAPLGACSVVAGTNQDWAIGTARNTEVVSDATNVLALEACSRRAALLTAGAAPSAAVHLATAQRLVRPQRYDNPAALPHFRLFGLCSAGRDPGAHRFEIDTLIEHCRFFLTAIGRMTSARLELTLSVFEPSETWQRVAGEVAAALTTAFPAAAVARDDMRTAGRGYYTGIAFHVHAIEPAETKTQLADGGFVDWAERLLGNRKERMVISGVGSDRIVALAGDPGE